MKFVKREFGIVEIDDKHLDDLAGRLKEIDPDVLEDMANNLMGKVLDEINKRCLVEAYRPLRYSRPFHFY